MIVCKTNLQERLVLRGETNKLLFDLQEETNKLLFDSLLLFQEKRTRAREAHARHVAAVHAASRPAGARRAEGAARRDTRHTSTACAACMEVLSLWQMG